MTARVSLEWVKHNSQVMSFSVQDTPMAFFLREVLTVTLREQRQSPSSLLAGLSFYYYPPSLPLPIALSLTSWALPLVGPLHPCKVPSAGSALAVHTDKY